MWAESIYRRQQMKQSAGLSGIFSKGELAVRISLFALLASILILAGPGMCGEPAAAPLDLRSKSPPAVSSATDDESTDLVNENKWNENEDPEPTPSVTEGPYFKPGSPERKSLLEPGVVGDRLNLTGRVLTRSGKPIAGALLDFWQADGNGRYDNAGYKLRGHQLTDDQGRYYLETVVPGNYGGRTRHIHVKVQAPGGAVLTTQLFFPGEENNQRDSIFTPELLVSLNETEKGKEAAFDFVLDTE
jgi:protocatechuate 3,4-dioxygenase beta subunit